MIIFTGKETSPSAYLTHDPVQPLLTQPELAAVGPNALPPPRLPGGSAKIHRAACQNVDAINLQMFGCEVTLKGKHVFGPRQKWLGGVDVQMHSAPLSPAAQDMNGRDKNVEYFLALDVINPGL